MSFEPPTPKNLEEILSALDSSISSAKQILAGFDEQKAMGSWKVTAGDREVFTIPRVAAARSILMNHWYHHRGQLTVYLRLLDVLLPAVYGRSADENPLTGV